MAIARRAFAVVAAVAILLGVVAAASWAVANVLVPPSLPIAEHPMQTYVAEVGRVGRSVRLAVTATVPAVEVLTAGRDGMVTSVRHVRSSEARPGEVIATVDLAPVVVAQGLVPMFRTLKKGMAGADVRQLSRLLSDLGYLSGPTRTKFTDAVVAATKRWQRAIGAPASGEVGQGALVFVPKLPARLTVIPRVGTRLTVGADLVLVLADEPRFEGMATASVRAEIETGMRVTISGAGMGELTGTLGTLEPTEDGRYRTTIEAVTCGASCAAIPSEGETALTGVIEVVPLTTGVVVPESAIVQLASGAPAVTLPDGTRRPLEVLARADGFAVVTGLPAGTAIVLPARAGP